jgi:hypothetical protein
MSSVERICARQDEKPMTGDARTASDLSGLAATGPAAAGQFDEVIIDLETTGLRWWAGDRMIGAGIWTPDGRPATCRSATRSGRTSPRNSSSSGRAGTPRQADRQHPHQVRPAHVPRDGIDLEAQGCTFGDVAHYAGLLDDHRRLFNQEDLALAYLAAPGLLTPRSARSRRPTATTWTRGSSRSTRPAWWRPAPRATSGSFTCSRPPCGRS